MRCSRPLTGLIFGVLLLFAGHVHASVGDSIASQVGRCWNVPVGGPSLSIPVVLDIDRDGVITDAVFTGQQSHSNDPYYKSIADSVMRALHNAKCSPLNLPADHYDNGNISRSSST